MFTSYEYVILHGLAESHGGRKSEKRDSESKEGGPSRNQSGVTKPVTEKHLTLSISLTPIWVKLIKLGSLGACRTYIPVIMKLVFFTLYRKITAGVLTECVCVCVCGV